MAGRPRTNAVIDALTTRASEVLSDIENATPLDYVEHWQASGKTLNKLGEELKEDPEFIVRYLRRTYGRDVVDQRLSEARARGSHRLIDNALGIADKATPEDVNVARLKVQTNQWTAEKWNREEFGQAKHQGITLNIGTLHLDALRAPKPLPVEITLGVGNSPDSTPFFLAGPMPKDIPNMDIDASIEGVRVHSVDAEGSAPTPEQLHKSAHIDDIIEGANYRNGR